MRSVVAAVALLAVLVPALASADEAPPLLPGRTAAINGTHVGCRATSISVTCSKAGGLTATLVKAGKVHVAKGSRSLFAAAPPMRLAVVVFLYDAAHSRHELRTFHQG